MPEKHKSPRRKSLHSQAEFTISPEGGKKELRAKLLNISESGIGVELASPLAVGSLVTVIGELQNTQVRKRARVCWCCPVHPNHHVGIKFEGAPGPAADIVCSDLQDHYEAVQLSPKADPDTIQRVYAILAQRYQADNPKTANETAFRRLVEAYTVLSDPERRSTYDKALEKSRRAQARANENGQAVQGLDAEKRQRQAILSLLYSKLVRDPQHAATTVKECEEMLGGACEHLQFNFWYLKENGLVIRSDNNQFQITIRGVNEFEKQPLLNAVDDGPRLISAAKTR